MRKEKRVPPRGSIGSNLTLEDIVKMAPELRAWSEMAARSLGLFQGINEAIKMARGKPSTADSHASEMRQQMILMALVRGFGLLDRDASASFQRVYQFLKTEGAIEKIAAHHASCEPKCSLEEALPACKNAADRFYIYYKEINFSALGRIQSFRNTEIAHISWKDAETAKVKYDDIEFLISTCCKLSAELSMMLTGLNAWPSKQIKLARHSAYTTWLPMLRA